ncbi:DUF2062 domain-containing protein [Halostella sp. JP-L12]|uniref:DUF2062 domain-containing protein n=1 Tax=Halostella TaxID=1843185 RepID=UPI000EF76280|nr:MULTISPECIES: DUF2062 domain-containing protein [Halostella]NHN48106.1 DUF2062 domain-containing protein [Halostella sp. JP-L12]
MGVGRVRGYWNQAKQQLRASFAEDHSPHHIAMSFAVGIFVTALPSLGTGLIVLAWVGYQFAWANKLALGAAVAVLNPLAKSSFYAASFATGTALLGPVPNFSVADLGLNAGTDVLARLLVGVAVLAVVLTVVSYVAVYRMVHAYRRRA